MGWNLVQLFSDCIYVQYLQNNNTSEKTLKRVSSLAGFTDCHRTSIPLHSKQGEYFDYMNSVRKHTHLHFINVFYVCQTREQWMVQESEDENSGLP